MAQDVQSPIPMTLDWTVRQATVSKENEYPGAERALTTQAIVELTEANVSTVSDASRWDREVAFLREQSGQSGREIAQDEVDDLIDLSTLMA